MQDVDTYAGCRRSRSLDLRTCVGEPRLAQAMTRGRELSRPPTPYPLMEDPSEPDADPMPDIHPMHDGIVRFYWAVSGEAVPLRENTYLHEAERRWWLVSALDTALTK